jgi:hypothetical protein
MPEAGGNIQNKQNEKQNLELQTNKRKRRKTTFEPTQAYDVDFVRKRFGELLVNSFN